MSKASGVHSDTHGLPHGWSRGFFDILWGPGHQLMHPEAYLDRLACTKQVSDLKNIIRSPFSSILLTFLSVSTFFAWLYVISCAFRWFPGYEKDAERYLESICPRISAWALFWTCLVNETMFCKYWHFSARRRAWKSKSNLWILAAWGLQEFKGPILMFYNIRN